MGLQKDQKEGQSLVLWIRGVYEGSQVVRIGRGLRLN
jgi:hypothetical protein